MGLPQRSADSSASPPLARGEHGVTRRLEKIGGQISDPVFVFGDHYGLASRGCHGTLQAAVNASSTSITRGR